MSDFGRTIRFARQIHDELGGILKSWNGGVHFRPGGSGIAMVSLSPEKPQLGKGGFRAEELKSNFEELFRKHCVERELKRETPEKQLQSFIISEAYRNGCRMEMFGLTDGEMLFVTDEIPAYTESGDKILCDILALRMKEDKAVAVLIELKSSRMMKELVSQLEQYSQIMQQRSSEYEQLYSAVLGKEIKFSGAVEKWIIWPAPDSNAQLKCDDRQESELAEKGIGVIQYVKTDNGFDFRVGRFPG